MIRENFSKSDSEKEPEKSINAKVAEQDLQRAIGDPGLVEFYTPEGVITADAKRASFHLAHVIGENLLYGNNFPDFDEIFTTPMAKVASEFLLNDIKRVQKNLEKLKKEKHIDSNSPDAADFDESSMQIVEARFGYWAVQTTLEESFVDTLDAGTEKNSGYGKLWADVLDAVNSLDDEMKKNMEIIKPITGTNALKNWRDGIVEPHKTLLPWFLDGTLEGKPGEF